MSALRLTAIYPGGARTSPLVLTDYAFLTALALALLIAVDPLDMLLERIIYTKHLALLLALPALVLSVAGYRMQAAAHAGRAGFSRNGRLPMGEMLSVMAPLLALAAFIIGGGLVARFHFGIQNSFLVAGVYICIAPLSAAMVLYSRNPVQLMRRYFNCVTVAGVIVFCGLAVNYGVKQVYHELEYLFPALAVLAALGTGSMTARAGKMAFFILLAFLFKKNTGYLAALSVIGYLYIVVFWRRWADMHIVKRAAVINWTLIAIIALGALIGYLYLNRAAYLPSGSPEFRLLTYERAWLRFLESPWIGTWFAAPGSEEFTGFDTGVSDNILPTHSDILDMLANGGALAILLWGWALVRIGLHAAVRILSPDLRDHPLAPYAHTLAAMSIVGVITYAFNPIFLQPGKAFLLWANLGLLTGAALKITQPAGNAFTEPQTPTS